MAKYTKEELSEIKKQNKMLLELLLKKTGTNRKTIIDLAEQQFIKSNIDILTTNEKRMFDKLVF